MKLKKILLLVEDTGEKLKSIPMEIKAYPVAVIGFRTFLFSEINDSNIYLFRYSEVFEPDQALLTESEELLSRYEQLEKQIKSVDGSKKIKDSKINTMKKESTKIRNQLIQNLSRVEFKPPQFELRFKEVDMDAIQKIKKHPIIRETGKTDMSTSSIRIIIG